MKYITVWLFFNIAISYAATIDTEDIFPKECGKRVIRPKRRGRIVNGKYAFFGEFPWMASIQDISGFAFCGATILNSRWLISAAHCFDHISHKTSQVIVKFGELDLKHDTEAQLSVVRKLDKMIIHSKYNASDLEYGYDLVLLKTDAPIPFDRHIQPICIDQYRLGERGNIAMLSGWGQLFYKGPHSSILQKVALPIIPNETCEKIYPNVPLKLKNMITEEMFICAGYRKGKRSPCQGDSGSALQMRGPNRKHYIIGVTSFSHHRCAARNNPAMFIRISSFIKWIEKTIYNNS